MSLVEEYKFPLLTESLQKAVPKPLQWGRNERILIDRKVKWMLEKGAIIQVCHKEGEFLSHIFLAGKIDVENRLLINPKNSNKFVYYQHFKLDALHCVKFLLQKMTTWAKLI